MLTLPRVYPVLDTGIAGRRGIPVLEAAEGLIEGGARIVQFRHKAFFGRDAYREARAVSAMCREAGALFVLNDRADIALLLGAALHLGQDDLPPAEARKLLPHVAIGFSTHNGEQVKVAVSEPIDYLALGPIFGTTTKENPDPVIGLPELARLRPLVPMPLVAIGGITRETAKEVWKAGADSAALVGDLYPAESTKASIRQRMEEWVRIANG